MKSQCSHGDVDGSEILEKLNNLKTLLKTFF